MKHITFLFLNFLFVFNLFASYESSLQLFHERMVERSPLYYEGATVLESSETPLEINQLAQDSYQDLIDFATAFDLFDVGFEYQLNEDVYEVVNELGEPIAYTFAIRIYKNNVLMSYGFYELMKRVDGVYYLSREPAWYDA
jgi:hypothetical protein